MTIVENSDIKKTNAKREVKLDYFK
ncbi:hypothetical protein JAG44_001586 [Citrobacter koseri]